MVKPVRSWIEKLFLVQSRFENGESELITQINPNTAVGDAFGRIRSSTPATLFDSQLQYDKQPILWDEKTIGSATSTHLPNESSVEMAVTTANGDSVIRQTREYIRYQPGKSQLVLCTFVLGSPQDGTTKLVGYGDGKNGIFIGQDGGGVFVLLRSSSSESVDDSRKVYQSDWNLNTFSLGTASGEDLDLSSTQILVIDFEWLGVGRVRLGLNINGVTYYFHEFLNANRLDKVYMTTANLPVRYEITNTKDVAASSSLKHICTSVSSEGGVESTITYPFSREILDVPIGTGVENETVVFAIRQSLLFKGIENRSKFRPARYEVLAEGGNIVTKVVYNPSIVGGTWVPIDGEYSSLEGNATATSYTGGVNVVTTIAPGGSPKEGNPVFDDVITAKLPFGLGIDGDDPIALALVAYSNINNVTASFTFHWDEVR